jgi:A/G-specific adenine glycosylase
MTARSRTPADVAPAEVERFRRALVRWARGNLRDFVWRRGDVSHFHGLVTEVLLARTRAEAVARVAEELYATYRTARELAAAGAPELERLLRPLGLYRKRAASLARLAERLEAEHGGEVPAEFARLEELPGVGPYAAGAFATFFRRERRPVVDANVVRVFERYFGLARTGDRLGDDRALWDFAARLLPRRGAAAYSWALLDLGGTVCTPRAPRCDACPLRRGCPSAQATKSASRSGGQGLPERPSRARSPAAARGGSGVRSARSTKAARSAASGGGGASTSKSPPGSRRPARKRSPPGVA